MPRRTFNFLGIIFRNHILPSQPVCQNFQVTQMTYLAIALNFFLLFFVTYTFFNSEIPMHGSFKYIVLALFAAPLANLFVIFRQNDEGLIPLYLKRKALEEKKRIQDLESRDTTNTGI
jgi:hypothetical protein